MKMCQQVKTCNDVFKADLPSLAKIGKQFTRDTAEAYISIWITNLVEFFQVGKRMGEFQIDETAMLVMDEYYMLTLADINLVFQRAKKGHYGELYDRLDGAIILSWFRKYFEERCETAESISMYEHKEHKRSIDNTRSSGKAKDLLKQATQRYQKEALQKQA